ncbi:hypothetical protein LMG3328_02374 [Achromobacter ruhlandii]|uniref:Uncharacterized protein n=1 Tax=Achromobacter ruhlandii TaxID=72557 RepID=A0A6S7CS77_9BURK|nr:hypothetical protein LMG3328_02374 [Achromobacter ruhlandii]
MFYSFRWIDGKDSCLTHALERVRIFAIGVEHDEACIRISAITRFSGGIHRPVDQSGNRTRLAAARIAEHGQVTAKEAVWVDSDFRVGRQWTYAYLDATILSRFDDGTELNLCRQQHRIAHRWISLYAAPELVAILAVAFARVEQKAQGVQAHLAQRVGQVHQAEVLHSLALGILRTLHGDPFHLGHQVALVAWRKHVSIDARKRTRRACVQRDSVRRLNVQQYLDLVGRDKVNRPDAQGVCVRQWRETHTGSPQSSVSCPLDLGALCLAAKRCLSSSLMRNVVLSMAALGR